MLRGFYTAASGMLMQQRNLNVFSNNIANVKTPGFKVERVVSTTFEQALLTRQEAGNTAVIGSGDPIKMVEDVASVFDPSLLEETGRPFDVAINGEGYFTIQSEDKQFLTRNGNFDLDAEGYLVLPGAGRVMGERGEIQPKSSNFMIAPDGTVYDSKNKVLDKITVSLPAKDVKLEKFSNGLYTVEDFETNVPAEESTLVQGTTERSNIDLNREYTMVMEAQRAFQACSEALKIVDAMNQKSATQIASI
ncbi:flagellar hook basal-body protein [Oscillospiraceae bacterium PP1C4]